MKITIWAQSRMPTWHYKKRWRSHSWSVVWSIYRSSYRRLNNYLQTWTGLNRTFLQRQSCWTRYVTMTNSYRKMQSWRMNYRKWKSRGWCRYSLEHGLHIRRSWIRSRDNHLGQSHTYYRRYFRFWLLMKLMFLNRVTCQDHRQQELWTWRSMSVREHCLNIDSHTGSRHIIRGEMERHIGILLKGNIIRESTRPYIASVLFTPKSGGASHMFIDYR